MSLPHYFAATETGSSDIFTALGIDWRLLIIQIVAFLLLVVVLGKFVYPWLMKSVDERQKNIEDAKKATDEARDLAAKNKDEVEKLLAEARKEASEIVTTAKDEATDIVARSEDKARRSAEKIAKDAEVQLAHNIEAAKKELHNETLELIALATEKVVGKVHGKQADSALIADAMKEAKK